MKAVLLLLALGVAPLARPAAVHAQASPEAPAMTAMTADDLLRRRVENFSRSGRNDEAIALLEERRTARTLSPDLAHRLVRLYREAGRFEDVQALLFEVTPDIADMDFVDLRQLAEAQQSLGQQKAAASTLERAIQLDPLDPSQVAVIANIYAQWGNEQQAIDVLLAARKRMERPLEFAQSLSRHYAQLGDGESAVREACRVVAAGPLNLAIMRGQIVELSDQFADAGPELLQAAREVAADYPDVPQLEILVAELAIALGDEDGAWEGLRPLVSEAALGQDLLRIAIAGLADSRLPDADEESSLRRLRLSVRIARGLLGNETLPRSLEPRAYDTLVRSLLGVLDNASFADLDDSERALWLDESREAVLDMNTRYPGNRLAAEATLRLAEVYTDALGDPQKAADLFASVAQDPSASAENILAARLGLARAYVVAGDTLRAREDFERIGADRSVPEGQNRAQYQLGLLDFMGGQYAEAGDRLKAVALRAPREAYTNDALDLAILIAEEQLSGAPDEEGLRQYGIMLYQRATHDAASMTATLQLIAARPMSPVRDRSILNLAELYESQGDHRTALQWADRMIEASPDSRSVATALDLRATLLLELGRTDQARESWERILIEYEDYVMADRVRDRLAELRGKSPEPLDGEVP